MVYLFEAELSGNSTVLFELKKIYGIGFKKSELICKKLGICKNFKIKNLSKEQILEISKLIESLNLVLGSDLKTSKKLYLDALVSIKSYRGLRRLQGLPVRGQRTHTNAKTSRKKF